MDASHVLRRLLTTLDHRGMLKAVLPPDPLNPAPRDGLESVPPASELGRVLGVCDGFTLVDETVYSFRRLSSSESMFPGLFCATLCGCSDTYGNEIVIEIDARGQISLSVFYICHDPPVLMRTHFRIGGLFTDISCGRYTESDSDARADAARDAYTRDPSVSEIYAARLADGDPHLRHWLAGLPSERRHYDLGLAKPFNGVILDVFGTTTDLRRYRRSTLFAVVRS